MKFGEGREGGNAGGLEPGRHWFGGLLRLKGRVGGFESGLVKDCGSEDVSA